MTTVPLILRLPADLHARLAEVERAAGRRERELTSPAELARLAQGVRPTC